MVQSQSASFVPYWTRLSEMQDNLYRSIPRRRQRQYPGKLLIEDCGSIDLSLDFIFWLRITEKHP